MTPIKPILFNLEVDLEDLEIFKTGIQTYLKNLAPFMDFSSLDTFECHYAIKLNTLRAIDRYLGTEGSDYTEFLNEMEQILKKNSDGLDKEDNNETDS